MCGLIVQEQAFFRTDAERLCAGSASKLQFFQQNCDTLIE
jgi:hypothetical protein